MNYCNVKKTTRLMAVGLCLLAAGTSWGTVTELFFRAAAVTNTMPDGRQVVMWAFAQDSGPGVTDGVPTVPGPVISLGSGKKQSLLVHLKNTLPVTVSIVIPGLPAALGDPQRNADGRARSFTREVPPGGTADYRWESVASGTYLYHSGSHPAVQVQMGLYGALTKLESGSPQSTGSKRAYQGVPVHNGEVILLFSAIDPDLHDAVATGTYGPGQAMSSTLRYAPQYFMINGQCYTDGQPFIPAGDAGANVLLRLLNADIDYHVPVLNGYHLSFIAEDGKKYPDARTQYAPMLPPLKTMDAFWRPDAAGIFPLYDRRLGLVNGTQTPGGMLTRLGVGRTSTQAQRITIPQSGNAAPYPSSLTVSGFDGTIGRITVTLRGFRHGRPRDVDVLLVSPDGQKVLLMSDAGGNSFVKDITLAFNDAAAASLTSSKLSSGTYKPTNLPDGDADDFPGAPAGPVHAALSVLEGAAPNGTWRLYVRDDQASKKGRIVDGWSLSIMPQ
ncbi:MAG: multicopper oxidase domain-containing protein [Kiritimatiellae bacterium]|nr:multicopper oxidase domain-containing protein [Kiritimatiellia bacterium]